MKKSLVSLLTVGVLLAPSALVLAEETTTDPDADLSLVDSKPVSWDDERLDIDDYISTTPIPFEVEYTENLNVFEGQEQVITNGVDGVLTTTTQTAQWNGNAATWLPGGGVRVLENITLQPVNKVIEIGTGVRGEEKDTNRYEIPYDIKVVENDELEIGEEVVSQEGVMGWIEVTTVYETINGERTGVIIGEEGAETDRKEPVNKIIQKGTKEVEDEFVVTATLVDEEGNALAGEVLTITGEDVEQKLTTNENGVVTFSVPNGTYTVAFGINSKTVVVEDEDTSVELVAGPKEVTPDPEFYIGVVRNDFPQFDKEGNEYDVEDLADFVIITITEKDGKFVAEVEYNKADQTTRIVSIPPTPLELAKPIEETTEEETTTVEVVTDNGATPVQVIRSTSTESSRAELPETGELGGGLTVLAGALSALGGLGLLFKKRK